MAVQKLFEPIVIGKTTIRNRVAMAPMVTQYADRGHVSEQQLAYYAARARGGVGLIITEATLVSKREAEAAPLNLLHLYEPIHMLGFAELADTIHAFGAKAFVQMNIGVGVQRPPLPGGVEPVGPSAVGYRVPPAMLPRNMQEAFSPFMVGQTPREMSIEEIEEAQAEFVTAATMARVAGFDGLEIHSAHGFLLHDFLSPRFNVRTDRYGGSLENRMRFLLELLQKTRAAVGTDMVIGVRASASEHTTGGATVDDTTLVVRRLAQEAIDYFHVGDGTFESLKYTTPDEAGTMLEAAAAFKKVAGRLPILTPSIHDPATAERVVRDGITDMVALGRQLIVDPDWANKVRRGRAADIRRCDRCNRGCFARIFGGLRVKCVLNPESGIERYNPQYTRWAVRQRGIEQRRRGSVRRQASAA